MRTPQKLPEGVTPEQLLLESATKTERQLAKDYQVCQTRINQLKNKARMAQNRRFDKQA